MGERTSSASPMPRVAHVSASTVPSAAPGTPRPAPGMWMARLPSVKSMPGKMSSALKTTSRTHAAMVSRLGVFMSPEHCRPPAKTRFSAQSGIVMENQKK